MCLLPRPTLRRDREHYLRVKNFSLGDPNFQAFASKALDSKVHPSLDLVWLSL
jgi:hypothetical protein